MFLECCALCDVKQVYKGWLRRGGVCTCRAFILCPLRSGLSADISHCHVPLLTQTLLRRHIYTTPHQIDTYKVCFPKSKNERQSRKPPRSANKSNTGRHVRVATEQKVD